MSLTKKVFSNFVLQIISRVIALLAGMLIISLMMRYLGPRQYGYYSISIAFLQVFGIIADFGLYLITLRYLGEADSLPAKERKERISYLMGNVFSLRLFSAFIFYGGAFVLSFLFPYPLVVKAGIGILSGSLFFCTLIQTLSAFYQKMLATQSIFWGEVLGKIVTLFLMIFLISRQAGFYLILSSFVFGNLVNFLILFLKAKSWIALRCRFDFVFWKKILKDCWPIGLAIIFNVLYFKADTLILSFYRPPEEVGYYGGAYRILEVLITVPPLFLGLVLPRLSQAWANHNLKKLKELFQKSFDFLVMLAWPLVLGTLVLGKKIMILIGGPEFSSAGNILRLIIIACGILFVGELFKQLAVSLGQQKKILPFYLITAVFSLVAYFIFIPVYSYWGAALVTIFSEFLMFTFSFFLFYRLTKISPRLDFFWKSLFASLLMALVLFWLINWSIFFLIMVAPLIYFSILYFIKAIRPQNFL
jgi:O-antigen/teichoic acid export membrane protein